MAVSPSVRINVSGARGPRGAASGPLGAGSVDAETISDDSAEQQAIVGKLGLSSPSGSSLIGAIRSATGAVTRWVSDKIFETWSFEDFGAVGDGAIDSDGLISGTDDTAAIQAAIDAAAASGARIRMLGKFYRVTAPIVIPQNVSILGCGANIETALPANVGFRKPKSGTWFLLDHSGVGIYCRDDSSVGEAKHFCRLHDFGTYREQPAPGTGWAPTVYSEDIRVESRVDVDDLVLLDPYLGIKVRSNGVLQVGTLKGQPLYTGIEFERTSDINNIGVVHFWPFWCQESTVTAYTVANAVALRIRRADGLRVDRIFTYGYAWTLDAQDVSGDASGFASYSFNAIYCDKAGGGVRIKSDYYQSYGTIGSITVNSDSAVGGSGAAVEVGGGVASLHNINGLAVTRSHAQAVKATGAAHVVNVAPYKVQDWDRLGASAYAFAADDGATINLLTIPVYSGGNGLIYNQGSNGGIINYPVRYQVGRPIVGPTAFYSQRANIADDGVFSFAVPTTDKTVNLHITPAAVPAAGNPAGSVWLRATGSPSVGPNTQLSHTANVDLGTGALTGTTGTDGNLTIHSASDGKIYVENRTGVARTFIFTMLGN